MPRRQTQTALSSRAGGHRARRKALPVLAVSASLMVAATFSYGPAAVASPPGVPTHHLAPYRGASHGAIPGHYIVTYRSGLATATIGQKARSGGFSAHSLWERGNGPRVYSAALSAAQLQAVRADPQVAAVEQDTVLHVTSTIQTQYLDWGQDRIDQLTLPLDGRFTYDDTGAGVVAYIVDTGLRSTHVEFTGRTLPGVSTVTGTVASDTADCNGHGTFVAGKLGGTLYGIAKGVNVVPVRVMDCTGAGTASDIIAGLNWISAHATAGTPAVVNMSLGGDTISAGIDAAVQQLINQGLTVVVAAGNTPTDACTTSPGHISAAITVGWSDITDVASPHSAQGPCVDLFAPGSGIIAAFYTADNALGQGDGTSMAAPQVAGAAAMYLQSHPSATPAQVALALKSIAARCKLATTSLFATSPDLLLQIPRTTSVFSGAPEVCAANITAVSGRTATIRVMAADESLAGYVWSLDQSAATPTLGTTVASSDPVVLATAPGDGLWYAHVGAIDTDGNASAVMTVGPFLADGTAPVLGAVAATVTGYYGHITATASDAVSGVAGYRIRWSHTRAGGAGSATVANPSAVWTKLSSGTWYAHVTAVDKYGNVTGVRVLGPYHAPGKCVVPAVKGLTLTQAKLALTHAGCGYGGVTVISTSAVGPGRVLKTSLARGRKLAYGTKVRLYRRK